MDFSIALLGLALAIPLMLVVGILVRLTSRGPVLFRQWRSGQNGRPFQLLKFRTMRQNSEDSGPHLTRDGDSRITYVGKWLRRSKLDELPQLLNVIRGDMSLVGPRPDLPEIWSAAGETERAALALNPGLTGAASLSFRHEELVLAQAPPGQLLKFYLTFVLPQKVRLDLEYASTASFYTDCLLLIRTVCPPLRLKVTPIESLLLHEQISRQ